MRELRTVASRSGSRRRRSATLQPGELVDDDDVGVAVQHAQVRRGRGLDVELAAGEHVFRPRRRWSSAASAPEHARAHARLAHAAAEMDRATVQLAEGAALVVDVLEREPDRFALARRAYVQDRAIAIVS